MKRHVPFVGPSYDEEAEIAHKSTFLQTLIEGEELWQSTPLPSEFRRYFGWFGITIMEIIKDLKREEKNDDYMTSMVHCEMHSSTVWLACRLIGDRVGQKLVEARLKEGWENALELIQSNQGILETWSTQAQIPKDLFETS